MLTKSSSLTTSFPSLKTTFIDCVGGGGAPPAKVSARFLFLAASAALAAFPWKSGGKKKKKTCTHKKKKKRQNNNQGEQQTTNARHVNKSGWTAYNSTGQRHAKRLKRIFKTFKSSNYSVVSITVQRFRIDIPGIFENTDRGPQFGIVPFPRIFSFDAKARARVFPPVFFLPVLDPGWGFCFIPPNNQQP